MEDQYLSIAFKLKASGYFLNLDICLVVKWLTVLLPKFSSHAEDGMVQPGKPTRCQCKFDHIVPLGQGQSGSTEPPSTSGSM